MFQKLELRSITRSFGGYNALHSMNLSIRAGEFVSLLGPSGCGKSTALNCLSGLLSLSSGEIWLDDRRVDIAPPEKRGFGMVFQNYALFPHMTVAKNIAFGLAMRNVSGSEQKKRVDAALSLIKLTAHADKLPGQLSGGQQQRVAIARAIVIEPPLVLMDEPLSNLDAALRIEMREEILRIHKTLGLTTIYVTHDQDEALAMSDRIVVMKEGVMQQQGLPSDLYNRPTNLDVALFMGYRNLLPVTPATSHSGFAVGFDENVLPATAVGPIQGVGSMIAAFKPDDVSLGETGLLATVSEVTYGGRESTVKLTLANSVTVHARVRDRVNEGEVVRFSVPADHLLVYPEPAKPAMRS
ncbi:MULTISPECIES: ABC transporter ATP-binding protein [Agrobacterium]|uniref:ABC transporter ATP-binding protein n=1 Tax=Agrobacterium TaxID=357 RepID=UPI00037571D7|nr:MULTISPECIES: ABC transporter ATP-binding protein [Agrobacterium]EPR21162.1 ABC transporter ATP-binding protein [Agrobacterium radiobacter DSM 30147]KDR86805.1 spermidine/putrescine ABC transporter ATP-binding protein [Agrobacterium tumefaciens GW4]